MESKKVEINGVVYVPESSVNVFDKNNLPCVMVRTASAGVHYGFLEKRKSTLAGIEVTLRHSRRVYYWAGAATLSQLSQTGTSKPNDCKFPCFVDKIELLAIEIIAMKKEAIDSLNSVNIWEQ